MSSPALGAIFDWDGVIVDSSQAHEAAWELLGAETGRPLPAGHFKAGFGRKNEHIIPNILKWNLPEAEVVRLGRRKEQLYRDVLKKRGIAPLPGVREFLVALKAAGVPCAVGSSTERLNIDTILDVIKLHDYFATIVAADDVTRGKPDPQVFLLGAQRIGIAPARCVVFEDAFAGLEAARAGGMKCVGVATTHPPEALRGHADRVVRRLDELSVEDLRSLVN
ncbi:MAG TPA: HAD family phosphatase [Candidatus Didemnitutus sp.]|nr:HAD family phosphatase [Candidatus Didemnitutus sp.]